MKISIGTIIKSFDFFGHDSYYTVGEVKEIQGDILICRTIKQVQDHKEREIFSPEFRTPVQGSMMMDEQFDRIIVLE